MRWVTIVIALITLSCQDQNQQTSNQINIDSLLDYHLKNLNESGATLNKISKINNNVKATELKSQNIEWENELAPFRSIASINKPIYSSSYDITVKSDNKSNLTVKTWTAKNNLPIKSLKAYYLKDLTRIKRLDATFEQKSFVFSSIKELSLDFSLLGPGPTTNKYEIYGYQKFFWEEPQYFSLEGIILLK